jgi:hypothetical protein
MKSKLEGKNLDNVLNMDQTPIPFLYHSSMMLEVKGVWTVHSRASTTEMKHVTLAATVTASGKMLPPFLIFKCMPKGCITLCKFGMYLSAGRYACQEKAWMNKFKMNEWIDVLLQLWKANWDKTTHLLSHPSLF